MNTDRADKLFAALSGISISLKKRLIQSYSELKRAAISGENDLVGLRGGKFCELMLRALQELATGSYIPLGQKLGNFNFECEALGKLPKESSHESVRVTIPRALSFIYTLRNKRDIGHVGGDVDANKIDAAAIVRLSDWCVCELVRLLHGIPLEDAQVLCDALAEKRLPKIWDVAGKKRVLDTSLSHKDKTLLLLYTQTDVGVPIEDLFEWTEHTHFSNYRRDVLSGLHSRRLIEWDRDTDIAIISPLGSEYVEKDIFGRIGYPDL